MSAYLLDTNHVGLAVDRTSVVGRRIFEARLAGIRLGTCLPVLCEIEAGIRQVQRKAKYRRDLNHLLLQLRLWPMDLKTTEIYHWTTPWHQPAQVRDVQLRRREMIDTVRPKS
jgi:predicted nucleic acid-binding protein